MILPNFDSVVSTHPEAQNVKWSWSMEWYDGGPIEGMVEWNKRQYWTIWFKELKDDLTYGTVRFFALLELTTEQQKSETFWRKLFEFCKEDEIMLRFYYARRKADYKELNLKQEQIIGWFRSGRIKL